MDGVILGLDTGRRNALGRFLSRKGKLPVCYRTSRNTQTLPTSCGGDSQSYVAFVRERMEGGGAHGGFKGASNNGFQGPYGGGVGGGGQFFGGFHGDGRGQGPGWGNQMPNQQMQGGNAWSYGHQHGGPFIPSGFGTNAQTKAVADLI